MTGSLYRNYRQIVRATRGQYLALSKAWWSFSG